jgi:hypothetical protein
MLIVATALLLAAAAPHAATTPPPGTTVFWSEQGPQPGPGQAGPSSIQAGTGLGGPAAAVQGIVSGSANIRGPNGVEAIDDRLWWPDQQLGRISSAAPDGSGLRSFATGNTYDLDIEAGTLYWTALNSNSLFVVADPNAATPTSSVLLSGLSNPFAVDAAGGFLYWSEVAGTDRLRRSNLDGSNPVTLVTGIQSYDFEVTGGFIYLSTTFGEVVRTNLDGSGRVTLASGLGFLNGIDVDGNTIYVSSLFGSIQAMGLNGQDVTTLVSSSVGAQYRGVAVVSSVPEPGMAALWLAGLGVLGGMQARRRHRA